MSDTGFPNPAQMPRPGETATPRTREETALKIIAARGEMTAQRKAERIEGEVTRTQPDGTITIRTKKGEIDVKPRPAPQQTFQTGQKVELDIPPGQPPRQVIVRPAPDAPPPQSSQPPQPLPPSRTNFAPDIVEPRPTLPEQIQNLIQTKIQFKIQTKIQETLSELGLAPRPALPGGEVNRVAPAPLQPDAIVRIRLYNPVTDGPAIPVPAAPPSAFSQSALPQQPPPPVATALPGQKPAATQIQITPAPLPPNYGTPIFPATGPNLALQPPAMGQDTSLFKATLSPVTDLPQMTQKPILQTTQQQPAPLVFMPSSHTIDVRVVSINIDTATRLTAPAPQVAEQNGLLLPPTPQKENPIQNTAPATTHRATVVGMTAQTHPLITVSPAPLINALPAPGGKADIFLMHYPALNLPLGSEIILQPITAPTAHPTPVATSLAPAMPFDLMRGWAWPAFDDTFDLLQQTQIQQGIATDNAATLPLPNAAQPGKIPAALLFFMAAVRAGDLGGWLGERALNALRRDSTIKAGDILSRIGRDFSGLTRMADQPVSQDWRAMAFPFLYQGDLTKIHLYYRHQDAQKHKDSDSPDEKSTRFIFDLHLSQMGDVQLDGLMKSKRLDMVVRSEQPFSATMQQEMRRAYHAALEAGGLHGDLLFQNRPDQFVRVEIKPTEIGLTA